MNKLFKWAVTTAAGLMTCVAFAQPTKVALGYPPAADWLPAMVAKDAGIFEKNGLDVSLDKIAIVSNIPAAIMAGSLNIGAVTPTMLIDTSNSGLDLVAVVGATRFVKDPAGLSIVARKGAGIKTAKDMEGKKVGIPGIRSVADVMFRKWLMQNDVDVSKVSIVEVSFPQMKDLLKAGTVDAVPVLEPFRAGILADETGYWVSDYMAEVNPDILGVMWAASRSWLDKNPTVAPAFKKSIAEGVEFIHANPEKAREIEKKYLGFNTKLAIPYSLTLDPAEFEFYAKLFHETGFVDKVADTSKLIY